MFLRQAERLLLHLIRSKFRTPQSNPCFPILGQWSISLRGPLPIEREGARYRSNLLVQFVARAQSYLHLDPKWRLWTPPVPAYVQSLEVSATNRFWRTGCGEMHA